MLRLADDVDGPDAERIPLIGREILELKCGRVGRHVDILEDLGVALAVPLKGAN